MHAIDATADAGAHRWLILAGVWLLYFCFGLTAAAMGPLVAPIGAELQIGHGTMGAILGAWPLVYIFAAVPCGLALDRFGARPMLFLAALVMAGSGFARSLSETPLQMLLAVGIFGIGGPLISVGAPKVIAGLFEGKARATAMGVYVTGPYLGGLVALALTNGFAMPLLGGDWRAVLQAYGALVLGAGVVWLLLTTGGLREGAGGKKYNLRAFAEILQLRAVQLVLALSIGIFFFNHALNNWLPEILRDKGMSAAVAGYWASVPAAVGVLGALIVPRFATPQHRLAVMGALIAAALAASLMLQAGQGPVLAAGLVLQGLARGSMMTVAILILMEMPDMPRDRLGMAGGLFFTAAEIGGVLGPLTFGILSALAGGFAIPLVSATASTLVMALLLFRLRASMPGALA